MNLNYEALYLMAKTKAKHKAECLWPPFSVKQREKAEKRLTREYYLQYITP